MASSGASTDGPSSGISSAGNSLEEIENNEDTPLIRTTTLNGMRDRENSVWYVRIAFEFKSASNEACDLWERRDCWSKLCAVLLFISVPLRALARAVLPHDGVTIPNHSSVGYFFLLMCYMLVINLTGIGDNQESAKKLVPVRQIRNWFVSGCMVLAIVAMLYIYLFTKNRARHDPSHNAPIRLFYRGALYLFGLVSVFNSICLAADEWHCSPSIYRNNKSGATVQAVKALYIVVETLFVGYFHKACLPLDTAFLQISLAHILGTNLTLWFWTLCEEASSMDISNCTTKPVEWHSYYQRYFYPVFVEYLILAIAILYELWVNLTPITRSASLLCENCPECISRSLNNVAQETNDVETDTIARRSYVPRCGFGIMIGIIYLILFLAVLLSSIDGEHSLARKTNSTSKFETKLTFQIYCYGSFFMYLSQISACYVILASLHSPRLLQRIRPIDYDDALLYISLLGILLLEGFHMMSKLLTGVPYFYVYAVDVSGTVQHLTQVVTLMNLRHYRRASSYESKKWICECSLFLLLTNIVWWLEDSFYLEPKLTRPGEYSTMDGLDTYGYIVKPMVVFYRFHSATYFFNAWTIYRN